MNRMANEPSHALGGQPDLIGTDSETPRLLLGESGGTSGIDAQLRGAVTPGSRDVPFRCVDEFVLGDANRRGEPLDEGAVVGREFRVRPRGSEGVGGLVCCTHRHR